MKRETDTALGTLRGVITLLVVVHHSLLAYLPGAPPPTGSLTEEQWWRAFPVVDASSWKPFSVIVFWNDSFFMALMFLLSGLFAWDSLGRKGTGRFLLDRLRRLGVPFVLSALLLAPLAYYPTYLQNDGHGLAGFVKQWLALEGWPAGPAWFLWVLFALDLVAATLHTVARRAVPLVGRALRHPLAFFAILVALSTAVYVPLVLKVGPFDWLTYGPFVVQTSRIGHYAVYFLVGLALGSAGREQVGRLARAWWAWVVLAVVAFLFFGGAVDRAMAGDELWGQIAAYASTVSCAATSFGMMALFTRFARRGSSAARSLQANAYGIYLLHYAAVSWLQLALLGVDLPGVAKGVIVVGSAAALSWVVTATLRRVPPIGRVLGAPTPTGPTARPA